MHWSPTASKRIPRRFHPVGCCVYCGATAPTPLTTEHVLPQGLGGGLILPRSSCDACRRITQKIEETCLRKMLLPYRLGVGLVQHPHEIPVETEVLIEKHPDRVERVRIPRARVPDFLVLPVLSERPGILTGRPPGAEAPYHFQLVINREEMSRVAASLGGSQVHVPTHIDMVAYFQMIAKIAHCFAVATLGSDGFDPCLPPLIVGNRIDLISHLIGASRDHLPVRPDALSHQIALGLIPHDDGQLVRSRVCLFAFHKAPAYDVIVGRLLLSQARFHSRVRASVHPGPSPPGRPRTLTRG